MAEVIAVHGINNTYSGAATMLAQWLPALQDGLAADHGSGNLQPDQLACVFWGDLFRPPGRFLGHLVPPNLNIEDIDSPEEHQLVLDWWQAAATTDSAVIPPNTRTLGRNGFPIQAALRALAGSTFLAGATETVLLFALRQVRDYFTRPQIREQIHARMAASITSDTRVIVGHSLGSVIAYEALCAHPEWKVQHFVSLGSPLGTPNLVFDRLTPRPERQPTGASRGVWPESVAHWTNISDRRDFIALDKRLHTLFGPELVDIVIDNGASWHDVTRYLTARETGAALRQALHGVT